MAASNPFSNNMRIGDPESLVKPGDPVPGKPGHFYEAGQYAPSPERLSAIKLQESIRAGLLPTLLEHEELKKIVNSSGEVDVNKLKSLDFTKYFKALGIEIVDPNLPKFAGIGLLSAFLSVPAYVYPFAKIKGISWLANIEGLQQMSLEEQMDALSNNTQIYKRNAITGFTKFPKGDGFTFVVLQPFFVYMSVPILPAIPNVSSGLNAATVSSTKTVGHLVYKELSKRNKDLWSSFMKAAGWKRESDLYGDEEFNYRPGGWEIGLKKTTIWYRDIRISPISANFTISPAESFSESFVYMWFHKLYMQKVNKDVADVMESVIEYISEVI